MENGSQRGKVRPFFVDRKKRAPKCPPLTLIPTADHFAAGLDAVLAAGVAVGLDFVSPFLSSSFLSSFAGLEVGLAVEVGLDTAAGEETVAGGVAAGLVSGAVPLHAPRNAANAAKTVSRIDLLIGFSFLYRSQMRLSGTAATDGMAVPAGFWFHSRMQEETAGRRIRDAFPGPDRRTSLQHCDRKNELQRKTCVISRLLWPILCACYTKPFTSLVNVIIYAPWIGWNGFCRL